MYIHVHVQLTLRLEYPEVLSSPPKPCLDLVYDAQPASLVHVTVGWT